MLYMPGFLNENFGLSTLMPELPTNRLRAFQQNIALANRA